MWFNLLPALGTVLSLAASGALASVTCDTKPVGSDIKSTDEHFRGDLVTEEVINCLENICAAEGTGRPLTEHCGPVAITITYFGAPFSDVRECTDQVHSIIDQCIGSEGVYGGISQTDEAIYDILVAKKSHDRDDALDERGLGHEHLALEARATSNRARPTATRSRKRITPLSTQKPTQKFSPKPTQKASPEPSSEAQPKICPLPADRKKKNKSNSTSRNTIRDIAESFLPRVLGGSLLPRGSTLSKCLSDPEEPQASSQPIPPPLPQPQIDVLPWYRKPPLANGVTWWSFDRVNHNEHGVPAGRAATVLDEMTQYGKFNVVKVTDGSLHVVGKKEASKRPYTPPEYAKYDDQGSYLLSNGGFFMSKLEHLQTPGYERFPLYTPIGENSFSVETRRAPAPIHADYTDLYKKLQGSDGNYLKSGPSLKTLNLGLSPLQWKNEGDPMEEQNNYPGSLTHANQPNERLAAATFPNGDKYLFVYTAGHRENSYGRARRNGVALDQLATLIRIFLEQFTQDRFDNAIEILNMDGGGSIYVSWVTNGAETVIARGGTLGKVDETNPKLLRPVSNMLKISPNRGLPSTSNPGSSSGP